ncbi:MAG: 16S rRNA (cytosine(1402)-N(4))-methyltransferase RsmH [Mycoplasmoidaceae bacterium]|nr:16S rRNA (cytosine(1402)-N(4))-methyltransferase RsmH [Mycoplasmoidaceae bacterium]
MNNLHNPVLLNEAIKMLNIKPNGIYVDCTCGRGGHTNKILSCLNSQGKIICLDMDSDAFKYLSNEFKDKKNVILVNRNFKDIKTILNSLDINKVDGIIADLGVSSPMFDDANRGFSYHFDARLDMRMDQNDQLDAYMVINSYEPKELTRVFRTYGEVNNPRNVVNAIVNERKIKPIETTGQLVDIIKNNVNKKDLFKSKHPARVYFQALRIEVNHELDNLKQLLTDSVEFLNKDGRLVIITFHSLEDRIVKQFFNDIIVTHIPKEVPIMNSNTDYELLTRKPIVPTENEIANNNRARSAKLRAIRRMN